MRISTGADNYKIIDSGTVITFNQEPLYFELAPDLIVILAFANNEGNPDLGMAYDSPKPNHIRITLTNFNSSLGNGNKRGVPIATVNNRQVYLNFMVYALSDSTNKTVHYTWYEREEVKNG